MPLQKWKWIAPVGLTLVGLGLSLTGEAIVMKYEGAIWYEWVAVGTLALIVVNSGLSIFGDAVVRRVWAEWEEREKRKGDGHGA